MDRQTGGEADWPGRGALYDLAGCVRFYSRLPVPQLPGEPDPHRAPDFTTLPRMLPLAGLILALPAALALVAAWWIGLGPFLAATLALAILVMATGALHEDGLADVADGFGGGGTRERRLEIMRDSRIGAYGGAALVLALALRIGALATLLDRTGAAAATALILAAALSRVAALAPMVLLEPARTGGLSASVGRPDRMSLATALGLGVALALAACLLGLPFGGVALMIVGAGLAALGMTALARGKIGGQTGDVIGACQQVAEIAALLALVAAVAPG
ncbi:cobalamin-5'-phosphate synthase [Methylobacterium phyllostachyos]|uniref:Adenosylcobinamide-GDP ribazoletransferase n=1 Tax=Methylobacterium phyllostachyos TaxID=582672 RepID=A0A1G9Y0S8_9HYPH|nr:adenosylcobinamide-GDP ribazoletransferase [Methylobacterium phyllostachyos]SDN02336.1 cobalamin-5'-phosphate synthase [Methylobacterium phyllostachyos]